MAVAVPRRTALRVVVWAFHLALPLLGLWLLLAQPQLDARWRHQGGHFALVVSVAATNVALGARMSEVSRRRADARLFLVSLVFLSSAGFLLLHALATPGVLLEGGNAGFAIATPVGLLLAAGFAAVSAVELTPPRAAGVLRRQALLRGGLALLLVAWAAVSLLGLPPLDVAPAEEATRTELELMAAAGVLLYAFAAARYWQLDGLFRTYMARDVATALLADPSQARLGGVVAEVTVLFADLRGFTPFSEQAPPERVVAMLNEHFGRAVPVLLAHGGSVTQFVGDAVMALFNAPTRQPDHALRAARAALGMQRAVEEVAVQEPGWPLFRVGVNTGPALVGNIGSAELRSFTAIGDTVNLAARLEELAEDGQVVIGPATYQAIAHVAVAHPLEEIEIRGKRQRVASWVLDGLHPDGGGRPR